jgi:hypothetical protein
MTRKLQIILSVSSVIECDTIALGLPNSTCGCNPPAATSWSVVQHDDRLLVMTIYPIDLVYPIESANR